MNSFVEAAATSSGPTGISETAVPVALSAQATSLCPWLVWAQRQLRCCPLCALRLAGIADPTLYACSTRALAEATGMRSPRSGTSCPSPTTPFAAADEAACSVCVGALCGDDWEALGVELKGTLAAAAHEDVSGFRLAVSLTPSSLGLVRDFAAACALKVESRATAPALFGSGRTLRHRGDCRCGTGSF
jgi:hypothetical protein